LALPDRPERSLRWSELISNSGTSPGKDEYTYVRLTLQGRYPDKLDQIHQLASEWRSLDDAIIKTVALDVGDHGAVHVRMNVLWNLPACSRCGKYCAAEHDGQPLLRL
jgi:hypothetical protein